MIGTITYRTFRFAPRCSASVNQLIASFCLIRPFPRSSTKQSLTSLVMHTQSSSIAMAQSLKPAILAILMLSAPLVDSLSFQVDRIIGTPTCNLLSNPSTAPAQIPASWCACTAPNGDRYLGLYPTTTSSGIISPTGRQLCAYTTTPSITITSTPVTCKIAAPTSGFTVPHSWCDCTAGTSTGTYSTGANGACSFAQDEFVPAATISPSPATCVNVTANSAYTPSGGPAYYAPFYNALGWCGCGDNTLYPLPPQTTSQFADSASVQSCAYTTPPSSTIALSALASTSCQPTIKLPWTSTICECSGDGTSILYPTGTQGCVFSSVPTPTSLPSLVGSFCDDVLIPSYDCDYDGKTTVSRIEETESKGGVANDCLFFQSLSATNRKTSDDLMSLYSNTVLLDIHVVPFMGFRQTNH